MTTPIPFDPNILKVPEGGPAPSPETKIETEGVISIVTQAFCPKGHNIIDGAPVTFEGHPGIRLGVGDGASEDEVVLSPIHGDRRKSMAEFYRLGSKLLLRCPTCGIPLDVLFPCSCGKGELIALYLTPALTEGHVAAVCNVWGCPRSRLIDRWQVISQFVDGSEE